MKEERALAPIIAFAGQVDSQDDLHALCRRIADHVGARWYLFGLRVACSSFVDPQVLLLDGYPDGLMARYRERGYIIIDPAVLHGYSHVVPVFWDEIYNPVAVDTPEHALLQDLRTFGLRTGMTVPVHGLNGELSLLNLAWDCDDQGTRVRLGQGVADAMYLAAHLYESASRVFVRKQSDSPPEPLTRREQECLMWCAEGKTSWETAQILSISERTVIFHLQNVNVKLGVSSRQQAVARATVRGIIMPIIRSLPDPC